MNIPVPPLFVYESDLAKYEVMDGQQRITAIKEFYGNKLVLRGLDQWPELNGRIYDKLPVFHEVMKYRLYGLGRVSSYAHEVNHRLKVFDECQTIYNAKIRKYFSKYFGAIILRINEKRIWQEHVAFAAQPVIEALNNLRLCETTVVAILAPFLKDLANSNSVLCSALVWQFRVIGVEVRQFAQVVGDQVRYELLVNRVKASKSSAVIKNLPI
jgi:hypothetical protein